MDQPKNNVIWDALIIGAGPAGLTSAYLLTKEHSRQVKVLEAHPNKVGGISRTEEHNGYKFDIGGHRFFSKSQEIEALWDEYLPDPKDFPSRPRISRIYYKDKFYSYPLKAFEVLKNLGIIESFLCICSYLLARFRPIKNPKTFHDWVRNQFGERLYNIFFKHYTEKVWGMSCDVISSDWAAQRIKGLNLSTAIFDSLKNSFKLSSTKKPTIKTLINQFRYPRKGPGMMWERVAEKLNECGGHLEMGVTALTYHWQQETNTWMVEAKNQVGETKTYYAKHIISSAPMRDVVSQTNPPPQSRSLAQKLKYRDFIIVAVMLNQKLAFQDNWIYIHDPRVKVGRIQNYAAWSKEMVPNENTSCLGLEYFCFEGDGLWEASDQTLADLAISELKQLNLIQTQDVIDHKVIRQTKAYPVYDKDYQTIVNSIYQEYLKDYPTMHFVGRNGLHKYNNQDHAMMTAILTVKKIMSGNHYNVLAVNEDAEYHEEAIETVNPALESVRAVPEQLMD